MKKSLLTLAILGTATLSAHAGIVLYGEVDAGFSYNHLKTTFTNQERASSSSLGVGGDSEHRLAPGETPPDFSYHSNSFKFSDGLLSANKIGLRGEEDINGLTVGFKLENGFNLSSGDLSTPGKIFDREARLYVRNDFGELALGRFGGLGSAAGSYDVFFENADAFDGGDNLIPWAYAATGRMDNSIAYQSPEVMGLQGTLMYSFNKDGEQKDKVKDNDRYAGAALTYKHDRFTLVGSAEVLLRDRETKDFYKTIENDDPDIGPQQRFAKPVDYKNGSIFNLGGNMDFDTFKVFAGVQWSRHVNLDEIQTGFSEQDRSMFFTNALRIAKQELENNTDATYPEFTDENIRLSSSYNAAALGLFQFNGYAASLGSIIPIKGDTLTLAGYFGSYKTAGNQQVATNLLKSPSLVLPMFDKSKVKTFGIAARLEHPLSKRTTLYTGAGYGETRFRYDYGNSEVKPYGTAKLKHRVGQVYLGLNHKF